MSSKRYTPEEIEYIEDRWGVTSIKAIANKLGRTVDAIKVKAIKMGLTDARKHLDGITIPQLSKCLGIESAIIYKHWIPHHNFPVKSKITCKTAKCRYITFSDFWKWAEQNKKLINLSRVEEGVLGEEPAWAKGKRKMDSVNIEKKLKQPWSEIDKKRLISLVKLQKYNITEISEMLGRSEAAISRKLWEFKIPDRPVGYEDKYFTPEDIKILLEMRAQGYGWNTIGKRLGRSVQSLRRKHESLQRRICNE